MLTFAVMFTLIHVNNAETCQEMESKSTVAASFVQTRRIEGKMIANEKEEAFLGADPQWFPNKHGDAQIEATNTTFYIEKCNAGTDPKKKMLEDARISHATCRSEQQTINGSNVSQNCYGEKKAACDSMQSIFEESYCTYAESKEDYCKEFEACHAAANSAHASAKQKVEQQEQDLREMYIQHRRLECKIAAWPLTTSSKSACESQSFDTSQLDVTYPTKPTQVPCNHPVFPVPGDSDWTAAEYSAKSWKRFVEPVKSCTTTTTTTLFTVPVTSLTPRAGCPNGGLSCCTYTQYDSRKGILPHDCQGWFSHANHGLTPEKITQKDFCNDTDTFCGMCDWTRDYLYAGNKCSLDPPYECKDTWVVVGFPERTTVKTMGFVNNWQAFEGVSKIEVSVADTLQGQYKNAQIFDFASMWDKNTGEIIKTTGNTGKSIIAFGGDKGKNTKLIPLEELTFAPPLVGQYIKITSLAAFGENNDGMCRVFFS